MDKTYMKGQRLFITTGDGTYNATFQSMDSEKTRLTVKDVVKHPLKEPYDGIYHFYKDEIVSVQIMDPVAFRTTSPRNDVISPKIASIMRGCTANSCHRSNNEPLVHSVLTPEAHDYYINLLKKFVIIDNIDDKFDQAIEFIKKQRIVGVSFEGAQLGRKGRLSWINICSPAMTDDENEIELDQKFYSMPSRVIVFIFDIAMMGSDAIELGLKDILEGRDSPNKVIHDCRLPSDCLYHHFNLKLENVLDSQVAEIIQFPLKSRLAEQEGMLPLLFTRALHKSLMISLGLPENIIYEPCFHDGCIQRDMEMIYERPITPMMSKAAAYQSMYLINLWCKVQNIEFMEIYKEGVKIYLSSVRDADNDTALYLTNCYHLVPDEFNPMLVKYREKICSRKKYRKKRSAVITEI